MKEGPLEAHYFLQDSSFNLNISYWDATMFTPSKQRSWIGVFLTATPEPLQLFLKYGSHKSTSLSDLIYHTKNKTEQLQQELDTPISDTPSLQDGWRSNIGDYHQLTRIEKEWIKSKNDPFHKLYDEMKTIFSGVQYDSIIEVIKNDFDYDYVEPYYFLEYNKNNKPPESEVCCLIN